MGLASAIGNTFSASVPQQQGGQAIQQRGGQPQQSGMGAPPTGLEDVDQVTSGFYQKWNDLETFASTMKLQYGIDVTKPSFGSEEGMEAHKMYQKALADLNYQGNRLKNSQAALTTAFKAKTSAHGDRVNMGQVANQAYDMGNFSMSEDTRQMDAAELRAKTQKSEGRLNRAARNKLALDKADLKLKEDEASFEPYVEIAKDLSRAMSGGVPWTTDEDGTQTSTFMSGVFYGSKGTKIAGLERETVDGQPSIYLVLDDDDDTRVEMTDENAPFMHNLLVQGKLGSSSGMKADVGGDWLSKIAKEGKSIRDFSPEDASSFTDKADKSYNVAKKAKDLEELKPILSDAVSDDEEGATLLTEKIKGRKYNGKTVVSFKANDNTTNGKMTVTLKDSSGNISTIIIGGVRGKDKTKFIDEVLKSEAAVSPFGVTLK